uniref:NADH-quinone oxidoreductase subunit C n=1 Tax=Sphingomonas bacterium TaxID=1895847 RepID=UPI001576148F
VEACRTIQDAGYNFLEDVTAVDWFPTEPRFQISYSILGHSLKQRIRLVARLKNTPSDPGQHARVDAIDTLRRDQAIAEQLAALREGLEIPAPRGGRGGKR